MEICISEKDLKKIETPLTPLEEAKQIRKSAMTAIKKANAKMREKYPDDEYIQKVFSDDAINEKDKLYDEGILEENININTPETWEEFLELNRRFTPEPPVDPTILYL